MTFRRARRTNDWLGWLTFGASLLGVVAGFVATFHVIPDDDNGVVNPLTGCCMGVFAPLAGFTGWQLIHPQKWEFVVEDGVIRWGRAVRPDKLQRVQLADIRRVVNDWREQRVIIETASGQTVVGDFVLILKSDRLAFLAFLKQHHPEIAVTEGP